MEKNNLIIGAIGIMICVILVGGLLVPIVSSVTATSDTYVNEGYYTMDKITNDYSLTWSYDNPSIVVVNGESMNITDNVVIGRENTILASDNTVVRMAKYNSGTIAINSYSDNKGFWSVTTGANDSLSITISGGVVTAIVTHNGTSTTLAYDPSDNIYAVMPNGSYVMKDSDTPAYVLDDSSIIVLAGITPANNINVGIFAYGTIDNLDFSIVNNSSASPTITGVTAVYEAVPNHVDLLKLEKYTFSITIDSTSTSATYSYFLVPKEITADRTAPMDSSIANIVSILPIIVIVALISVGVYLFIGRKF